MAFNKIVIFCMNEAFYLQEENIRWLVDRMEDIFQKIYIISKEKEYKEFCRRNHWTFLENNVFTENFRNSLEAYCKVWKTIGKDCLDAEEIIFWDDSFFGPFVPIEKMCDIMEKRKADYWSISKYSRRLSHKYTVLPERIDSSFLCFPKKTFETVAFERFWTANEVWGRTKEEAEITLTEFFDRQGFQRDTYIDFRDLESEQPMNNVKWLEELPHQMLDIYNTPIISKKSFARKNFAYTNENEMFYALKHIRKHYNFDTGIIWDYLLKKYNIAHLIERFRLHFVVPSQAAIPDTPVYKEKKTAIIMHITYEQVLDRCFDYIANIPEEIDLYITTKGNGCIGKIQKGLAAARKKNFKILPAGERGRDVSALLVTCRAFLMDYEYLCFVHDNKTRKNLGPAVIGQANMWDRWDNAIKNQEYITNILDLFEQNERLGLLVTPTPYYGNGFISLLGTWADSYDATTALARRLGLDADIDRNKNNYSIGTTFWCRPLAMRKLFEEKFSFMDFPEEPMPSDGTLGHAVERIFMFVAQQQGYFSGIMENEEYACRHISDLYFMLSNAIKKSASPIGSNFNSYLANLDMVNFIDFVKKYKNIYIYGRGVGGKKIGKILCDRGLRYKGYIISDNREIEKGNEPVFHLSQIEYDKKNTGIIVALGTFSQKEVIPVLYQRGYENLYII